MTQLGKWITGLRRGKAVGVISAAVCCVWGFGNGFSHACGTVPENVEIVEYSDQCCYAGNIRHYTFEKKGTWDYYKYEPQPWTCCLVEEKSRAYYDFATNFFNGWISYRDSLLHLLGEQDYEMHLSRDSMAALGIEYEDRIVKYHLHRQPKKIDSVYCLVLDSLKNAWGSPYQEFVIPQEQDCRNDILAELTAGCQVWRFPPRKNREKRRH